jgi:ribose transport system permease protein
MNPKTWGILVLMIVLWIVLAMVSPESFLQANNIENLLRRTAMHGLLGIAVAFVIITGGIDLSIGSLVGLSGCLLAMLLQVSHEPLNAWDVVRVNAAAKTLEVSVPDSSAVPQVGEVVRFFGGRRAPPAVITLESVTEFSGEGRPRRYILSGAGNFTQDDSTGRVARVFPAKIVPSDSAFYVDLTLPTSQLRAKDRLVLMDPGGQISEQLVQQVDARGDNSLVTLESKPGFQSDNIMALIMRRHVPLPLAWGIVCVLVVGALIGMVHGILVTKLGIQPFVVTLCGLLIYRGVTRWMVSDRTMGFGTDYANSLGKLAGGSWAPWGGEGGAGLGIPLITFLLIIVAVVAAVFLNRTIWGRYLFALGRNRDAARYAGISVDRITILAYVLCSTLTALGGIAFAADSNSIAPSSFGNFFELYAIAAAVLGGCSLRGGEGSIFGVVVGTALMQTLYNLIVLLKISDKLEFAVIGGVILLGVMADEFIRRYAAQRLARIRQAPT